MEYDYLHAPFFIINIFLKKGSHEFYDIILAG